MLELSSRNIELMMILYASQTERDPEEAFDFNGLRLDDYSCLLPMSYT